MAAWPLIFLISMEENKKDSCCAGGKCACHKKWLKIVMALAIALIIFLLGISVGSHFNRFEGKSFDRAGYSQCAAGGSCPMMRGGNRGAGIRNGNVDNGNVPAGIPETQLPKVEGGAPSATTTINQ